MFRVGLGSQYAKRYTLLRQFKLQGTGILGIAGRSDDNTNSGFISKEGLIRPPPGDSHNIGGRGIPMK